MSELRLNDIVEISELKGAYSSIVKLVKDKAGNEFILKTVKPQDEEEVYNEKFFLQTLKENSLPAINVIDCEGLSNNQILLEYLSKAREVDQVNSKEVYSLFGSTLKKMHNIKFESVFRIDAAGEKIDTSWSNFINDTEIYSNSRLARFKYELSEQDRVIVSEVFERLRSIKLNFISLLHCDLHGNNALYQDNQVYLFDKGSDIICGDSLFDLAMLSLNFPSELNLEVKDLQPEFLDQKSLFNSFIQAYGYDFRNSSNFYDYLLLHCVSRLGNPFQPFLENLIWALLSYLK
ncbi:MAG: hypothetical protein OHK0017_13800 [Patescibacteria group bacterium]